MEEHEQIPAPRKPAITIHIQSWTTPVVGIVMLLIGLFGGYYGRARLEPDTAPNAPGAAVPESVSPAAAPGAPAGNADLMDFVVSQARHFRGEENAPVTLIEFGDFQ